LNIGVTQCTFRFVCRNHSTIKKAFEVCITATSVLLALRPLASFYLHSQCLDAFKFHLAVFSVIKAYGSNIPSLYTGPVDGFVPAGGRQLELVL
jgi:hypothetical protein